MTSPALRHKIAKARAVAPHELPQARLCAQVIMAVMVGDEKAVESAVAQLKQGQGAIWSVVTAFQFMSGRRGEFAADCAAPEEQELMNLAHLVAKQVCSDGNESLRSAIQRVRIQIRSAAIRDESTEAGNDLEIPDQC